MSLESRRVYLDVSALCRPFDDQAQMRIRLETDAVLLILSHVRSKNLTLIVSPVHRVEIAAIADLAERKHLKYCSTRAEHAARSAWPADGSALKS